MLRIGLMLGFLMVVLLLAALLTLNLAHGLLAPIHWLGQYEAAHIIMHFLIFGGLMLLADPRQINSLRLWVFVIGGGVLLEVIQFVLGGFVVTRPAMVNILLDITVDTAGAAAGWWVVTTHAAAPRQLMKKSADSADF